MTAPERTKETERWFVQRGIFHLVESGSGTAIPDTVTRAIAGHVADTPARTVEPENLGDAVSGADPASDGWAS